MHASRWIATKLRDVTLGLGLGFYLRTVLVGPVNDDNCGAPPNEGWPVIASMTLVVPLGHRGMISSPACNSSRGSFLPSPRPVPPPHAFASARSALSGSPTTHAFQAYSPTARPLLISYDLRLAPRILRALGGRPLCRPGETRSPKGSSHKASPRPTSPPCAIGPGLPSCTAQQSPPRSGTNPGGASCQLHHASLREERHTPNLHPHTVVSQSRWHPRLASSPHPGPSGGRVDPCRAS
jgi:hypothetical protein